MGPFLFILSAVEGFDYAHPSTKILRLRSGLCLSPNYFSTGVLIPVIAPLYLIYTDYHYSFLFDVN